MRRRFNPSPASVTSEGITGSRFAAPLLLTLSASPVLLVLAEQLPRSQLGTFLGRFHTVVLHFPITLLFLAALLELIRGRAQSSRSDALTLTLFLGCGGAMLAAALGWLLLR